MAKAVTRTLSLGVLITVHAGAGEPTGAIPPVAVDGKLAKEGEPSVMKKPPPIAKVPAGHTAVDKALEACPATT
jgi:hypothetical protein